MLGVLEEVGLGNFLTANPFSRLTIQPDVTYNDRPVSGWYNFNTDEAQVSSLRFGEGEFGVVYQKQGFESISTLAVSPLDAISRTLIHEAGHHLHNQLRKSDFNFFLETLRPDRRLFGISSYATKDSLECFTETFSAYVFQRAELLSDDPRGYAMIEEVLHRLGINSTDLKELP